MSSTIGIDFAWIGPISGIVIWKSERTSSSIASNSWSVLSISSISRTTGTSELIASSSGRVSMNSSLKMSPRASSHEPSDSAWIRRSCLR